VVDADGETLEEGDEVLGVLLVGGGGAEGDGLHQEGLAQDVAGPHLVPQVDEQQRVALHRQQRIAPHHPSQQLHTTELAEVAVCGRKYSNIRSCCSGLSSTISAMYFVIFFCTTSSSKLSPLSSNCKSDCRFLCAKRRT
jgi:hypothetical protein